MTCVCGIDPGSSGGAAFVMDEGTAAGSSAFYRLAGTLGSVYELGRAMRLHKPALVLIEKGHSRPAEGVTSSWTSGFNHGTLQMMLVEAGVNWRLVSPRAWQRALGLVVMRADVDDPAQRKKAVKGNALRYAQNRFPQLKIYKYAADAWCIAAFALLELRQATTEPKP